jgi:hypothetical protein
MTASRHCRATYASTAVELSAPSLRRITSSPRVRFGIDTVENLVLADRRCNNDKRDLLPGPAHVTVWARRNERHGVGHPLAGGFAGGRAVWPGGVRLWRGSESGRSAVLRPREPAAHRVSKLRGAAFTSSDGAGAGEERSDGQDRRYQ